MAFLPAIASTLLFATSVHASTFLGAHPQTEIQSMPTQEVEMLLLSELASFGSDSRLGAAASELQPLFKAMPKNEGGKLDPTVVRYALHRYFARKYGWHLRGLEPRGGAWNASSPSTIMKDSAPSYIMELFEQRLHGRGLSLNELAVFAVTISDLIRKETVSDLEGIFATMGFSRASRLTNRDLARLIKTYLMTYITGVHTVKHTDFNQMEYTMESDVMVWNDAKMWVQDMRYSFLHTHFSRHNPFLGEYEYNFEDAAEVAQELGRHFGGFQNMECQALKAKLVDMEHAGSGRVALKKFYSGSGTLDWPFIESVDYLRSLGALDDSNPKQPTVIIPNFLGSPSNCEAPSNFYSVCCIDECESLLTHVEMMVAEPSATVARLTEIIANLQSDTVEAPRNLSSVQITRLGEIAEQHGGRVPLHGRLFAQWMHHAYPRECRFPHVAGSTNPLSRDEFTTQFGVHHEVTDEELAAYVDRATIPEPVAVTLPWATAEELIAPHMQETKPQPSAWGFARPLALIALVLTTVAPLLKAKSRMGLADVKEERHFV